MLRWILIIVVVDSTLLNGLRFTGDDFVHSSTLFGKRFIRDRRLALRKPLNPSCYNLFSLFSPFVLHFVYCYSNCLLLTHNCLLLPLVDVLILMDPNGLPLQVFKLVKEDYYGPRCDQRVARSIPCRHPARRTYGLAAVLPTDLPGSQSSPQTNPQFWSTRSLKGPRRNKYWGELYCNEEE